MAVDDPLEARLLHARNQLEKKVRAGEALEGDDLVDVRDDVVFVYQHLDNTLLKLERESRARDDALDLKKMNRNPTITKIIWILLPTLTTGLLAFMGYVLGQGGNNG